VAESAPAERASPFVTAGDPGAAGRFTPAADDDEATAAESRPGGWNVRLSPRQQVLAERMAQKRREEAVRVALDAASSAVAVTSERRGRRRGPEPTPLQGIDDVRPRVEDLLDRKRGGEVGALLQRAAQELGGRAIADLALDAGDRCLAQGQARAATNCFLAAWRADPIYEAPLWRLADVCLNDRETELAIGYLERIAALMRSCGDEEGALGVYRKIITIAPERRDIRDIIRLAQTTGRLDV
jgi:tetratricopeptide (TPR) repeat protein